MSEADHRPWLVSLGLHLLVAALAVVLLVETAAPPLPALRMRLVAAGTGTGPDPGTSNRDAWWPRHEAPVPRKDEPATPAWRPAPAVTTTEPSPVPAPVSLDELLGSQELPVPGTSPVAGSPAGWSTSGGEGYQTPPLPPPRLAPPQGARWTLRILVPGAGGYATSVEGLDSGNPELDAWLEAYLRTAVFPASLDGRDHELRWTLKLDSGRPR